MIAGGSLWYQRDNGLFRLDLATDEVTQAMAVTGGWRYGLATAGGIVWAVTDDGRGLAGFDGETGDRVRDLPGVVPYQLDQAWLHATDREVFVSFWSSDAVYRIDIASGILAGRASVPRPKGLVLADGSLWVLAARRDEVVRVDVATMAVTATIRIPAAKTNPVCGSCLQYAIASADSLWVISQDDENQLSRISFATNEVASVQRLPDHISRNLVIDERGDAWLAARPDGQDTAQLLRFSANSSVVAETIPLDTGLPPGESTTPFGIVAAGRMLHIITEEGFVLSVRN